MVELAITIQEVWVQSTEGPERHLNAARQHMPRDNVCHLMALQLPSLGGLGHLKEGLKPSHREEGQFRQH